MQAIAMDPDNPVHYSNRAAAYLMQELYTKALQDCKVVLAKNPSDTKSHLRGAGWLATASRVRSRVPPSSAGKAHLKKGELSEVGVAACCAAFA